MEEKYMIKVKDLCKQYGEGDSAVQVLNKVSFQVRKGECVAILGKSGSGKSTLLNVLGTLDKADSGEIYIGGENIIAYSKKKQAEFRRRKIGFIYQSYQLISILTVKDNILIPVQLDNSSIDWEYFHVLTKRLGIEQLLNRMPDQLSGGKRQRVAIARAMAMRPKMLYFDEPTSALDPELTAEILKLMKQLAAEKMTMVIVTHEIDFARAVSDRVIFMDEGVIVEEGKPEDVIDNPRNERTREFLKKLNY